MVRMKIDLRSRELSTINPEFMLDIFNEQNHENTIVTNNEFGWSVSYAEIEIESDIIQEFKLCSDDKNVICHAIKMKSNWIDYWCIEYKIRKLNYSPDLFEPQPEKFLSYFYTELNNNHTLYKAESTLPSVIYKINESGNLSIIRYSLDFSSDICKPLFHIDISESGYLFTLTDFQTTNQKHIVFPTPEFKQGYLIQKFGNHSNGNLYVREKTGTLKENYLLFKGINEFKVNYYSDQELELRLINWGFFPDDLRKIINDAQIILNYIPTINYHLIKPCNMRCRHCFSDFGEIKLSSLSYEDAESIIDEIASIKSFKKINFSGGEPTMFKGIEKLIKHAKEKGLETSIVTNGHNLIHSKTLFNSIFDSLDLIAFSIDSFDENLNIEIGRSVNNKTLTFEDFKMLSDKCHQKGVKIKINTVVTKLNSNAFLADKIIQLRPIRWKVLKMLPLESQNNKAFDIHPNEVEFKTFVTNNVEIAIENNIKVVTEENYEMTGSYLMISPDGKFFNNIESEHNYSESILEVGIVKALQQTPLLREVFYKRDGNYSCE